MKNHSDSRPIDDVSADPETVVYTREDDEPPSHSVVEAVAEATQTDPTRLRPLYEVVDTDALDDLITGGPERSGPPESLSITFRYEGCDVAVYGDGRTVVSPSARR